MILTRRRTSKPKVLTNGTYQCSLISINETMNKKCVFVFDCKQGQTKLELDINKKLWDLINQIAFLSGISAGQNVSLSDLIGVKLSITINNNKITNINKLT